MNQRETLTHGKAVNLDFAAQSVAVNNTSGAWVYVRVGGNDAPNAQNASYSVPPYTNDTRTVQPCRAFGFGVAAASGANPSNAQSPIATFYDAPQPAASMNIAQPQALFAPAWFYAEPVLSPSALIPLLNPGAGRLQIFKIRASCRTATYDQDIRFFISAGAQFVTLRVPTGGGLADELDLLPHGVALLNGQTLDVQNGSSLSIQPGIFVMYSVI